jgi:RNA polymerase sigma-70 factor, ECF subfamily
LRDSPGEAELPDPDLELVRRARRGDEAAFHMLVDRYGQELYGLAWSLTGNQADAEDVVQETFAGAFRALGAFEERASVKTWLVRILVRQAARIHRSKGNRKVFSLDGFPDPDAVAVDRTPQVDGLDARMDVAAMLDGLSEEHREVIVLRELEGMSYEEIAETLRVPRGTVESRLFRARQVLKERLKGYLA